MKKEAEDRSQRSGVKACKFY